MNKVIKLNILNYLNLYFILRLSNYLWRRSSWSVLLSKDRKNFREHLTFLHLFQWLRLDHSSRLILWSFWSPLVFRLYIWNTYGIILIVSYPILLNPKQLFKFLLSLCIFLNSCLLVFIVLFVFDRWSPLVENNLILLKSTMPKKIHIKGFDLRFSDLYSILFVRWDIYRLILATKSLHLLLKML